VTAALLFRLAIYSLIWWALTRGAVESWVLGVPAILLALCIDFYLGAYSQTRWSWVGSIAFLAFFLKTSVTSGLDVVRRTYHPRLPLAPAIIEYPLQLQSSTARNLFVCTVSLLPGTLSTALEGNKLVVHVLDVRRPVNRELNIIESRVAAVFRSQETVIHSDTRIE